MNSLTIKKKSNLTKNEKASLSLKSQLNKIVEFTGGRRSGLICLSDHIGKSATQPLDLIPDGGPRSFLFSEELLWCPNLESDETEITNYLSKWQGKSEDSNIADNEEALTQLMKSNYNFEDALGKKSEKTEIPTIYHEDITEEK